MHSGDNNEISIPLFSTVDAQFIIRAVKDNESLQDKRRLRTIITTIKKQVFKLSRS